MKAEKGTLQANAPFISIWVSLLPENFWDLWPHANICVNIKTFETYCF